MTEDSSAIQPEPAAVEAPAPGPLVTVRYAKRIVPYYAISDLELDAISSRYTSLYWTLFGIAVGAAVALGVAVTSPGLDPVRIGVYVGLLLGSAGIGVLCAVLGWRELRRTEATVERVKRQSSGL